MSVNNEIDMVFCKKTGIIKAALIFSNSGRRVRIPDASGFATAHDHASRSAIFPVRLGCDGDGRGVCCSRRGGFD